MLSQLALYAPSLKLHFAVEFKPIFKNIVLFLGFDYSFYETKSVLLDERLLAMRNNIAHGNYMLITASDYLEIHEKVLEMIEYFRNQIDNSASTKAYKRT